MDLLSKIIDLITYLLKIFQVSDSEQKVKERVEVQSDTAGEVVTKRPLPSFWSKRGL